MATATKKKTAKKKITKKKAATKKAGAAQKHTPAAKDHLKLISQEVEHLSTKAQAEKYVRNAHEDEGLGQYRLGGALSRIKEKQWYAPEYETFREYVEDRLGISYRAASYHIKIYEVLTDLGIPWSKVRDVGWSKLKELVRIIDADNLDGWLAFAKASTLVQVVEAVREALAANEGDGPSQTAPKDGSKTSRMSFTLHEDQRSTIAKALDAAMEDAETESDAVALETICSTYLSEPPTGKSEPAKQPSLKQMMKKAGPEKTVEIFEAVFPDLELAFAEGEE